MEQLAGRLTSSLSDLSSSVFFGSAVSDLMSRSAPHILRYSPTPPSFLPPGDGAGGGCGGEPGAAGGGVRPPAERHAPAGAADVAVAGPDPRPDRHPGGHAAAAAAGHTAAGTHTHTHTHTHTQAAINMSVSVYPSAACSVNTAAA